MIKSEEKQTITNKIHVPRCDLLDNGGSRIISHFHFFFFFFLLPPLKLIAKKGKKKEVIGTCFNLVDPYTNKELAQRVAVEEVTEEEREGTRTEPSLLFFIKS